MKMKEKESKDPAWTHSAFLAFENVCEDDSPGSIGNRQTEERNSARCGDNHWIRQKVRKEDTDIFAFLLLSGFGECNPITTYVAEKLIPSIFDSDELTIILKSLKVESDANSKDIDSRITDLIKISFVRVDNDCYEALQMLQIQNEEDTFNPALFLHSGCSAILALVLKNRLYIANCGNSVGVFGKIIGDGLMVFQVSETHEEASVADVYAPAEDSLQSTAQFYKTPWRCFGDYGRKTEVLDNRQYPPASSELFVIDGKIELNKTARFVLLIPPTTFKVLGRLYPELPQSPSLEQTNTPVSVLSKMIVDALKDASKSARQSTQEVLKELSNKFWSRFSNNFKGTSLPELCLAYIDLTNDYEVDSLNESDSNARLSASKSKKQALEPSASSTSVPNAEQFSAVPSYVDWSEFYTHELRDTVLAKIESIKQLYHERNTLKSIAEN